MLGVTNRMDANSNHDQEQTLPFHAYPHRGQELLGAVTGANCRHEYGLRFLQITGQHTCAYCGLNLVETYENWLTMALDHVVPDNVCKAWGLPHNWKEDYSNRVLCCTACNTFGNRYTPKEYTCPTTLEEFYAVRDRIFLERKTLREAEILVYPDADVGAMVRNHLPRSGSRERRCSRRAMAS